MSDMGDMINDVMKKIADDREALRIEHQKLLGEPVLYMPDVDDPRLGVGWFRIEGGFKAYRKMVTGYETHPCAAVTDDIVRALAPHVP